MKVFILSIAFLFVQNCYTVTESLKTPIPEKDEEIKFFSNDEKMEKVIQPNLGVKRIGNDFVLSVTEEEITNKIITKKYTEKELDAEAWELTNMLNNLSSFVNGFLLKKDPYECELSKRSKYKLYDILRPKILAYLKYRADSSLDFIQMMVFWFSLSSILTIILLKLSNEISLSKTCLSTNLLIRNSGSILLGSINK